MSFPVLQRMDRKRPEMIQPISWQAEAMKGLQQGLMTGLQMVSTINQIKLQNAANARSEKLAGLQTTLMGQQAKALELENSTKANQNRMQQMLMGGMIQDNTAQISLQQQGLMMDYTTGMTRLPMYNQQFKPDYVPKTLSEGLQSGYIQGPLLSEHHKTSALAYSNASTADKIVALDNMYEKTAPFANDFYAAENFSGVPMLAGLAQTLSPARYQMFMNDKVDATVTIKESNRNIIPPQLIEQKAKDEGTTPEALVTSSRPMQIPFGQAIGGLRAGYFEEDFARMTAQSSDPDKFIAYLKKSNVPDAIITKVKAQADTMRGIVNTKTNNGPPVLDASFDKTVETITLPSGEQIQRTADPGIIESVVNASNVSNDASEIMAEIDSRIETQEYPSLMSGYMPGAKQENVDRKKFQAEQWAVYSEAQPVIEAQLLKAKTEAETNPTKENKQRAKALQSVNNQLTKKRDELEKKYGFKKVSGVNAAISASATATAGTGGRFSIIEKSTGIKKIAPDEDTYRKAIASGKYSAAQ